MISVVQPMKEEPESRATTLGDVLYVDRSKVRVTEKDWLRLVQSIAARDQVAFRALYEQTHRIVFTLVFRIIQNRETAEEVTLDVYHDVWRRAPAYDPADGSVVGWIVNQARSRALDRLRFEHRQKRFNRHIDSLPTVTGADPQQLYEIEELSRHLRDALGGLTAEERRSIETAFFSELTYGEVAARLNQPVGTVKTRIRSGLAKLRSVLAERLKDL